MNLLFLLEQKLSAETSQNHLVFIPTKNTLNILVSLLWLTSGFLIECQNKILKI